jgi:hypothetical protein
VGDTNPAVANKSSRRLNEAFLSELSRAWAKVRGLGEDPKALSWQEGRVRVVKLPTISKLTFFDNNRDVVVEFTSSKN